MRPVPAPLFPGFLNGRFERFDRTGELGVERNSNRRLVERRASARRPRTRRPSTLEGFRCRIRATTAAVTGVPSWNLARLWQLRASGTTRQARLTNSRRAKARGRPSSLKLTRPSSDRLPTTCWSPASASLRWQAADADPQRRGRLAGSAARTRRHWAEPSSTTSQQSTPNIAKPGGRAGSSCSMLIYRCFVVQRDVVDEHIAVVARLRVDGALLDHLNLHCTLLVSAGDVVCQRPDRRFEAGFVTCRHVHVAKLCV